MTTKAELEEQNRSLESKIAELEKAAAVAPSPDRPEVALPPITNPSGVVKRFAFHDAYEHVELIGVEAGRFVDGNGVEHVQLCELPVKSIVPTVNLTINDL